MPIAPSSNLPKSSTDVLVIGGGAAGLMAAEAALDEGANVLLVDAMPSLARKVLMAGKSGLNLTKDEALEDFLDAYKGASIKNIVRDFGPVSVRQWADALGAECFIGTSGKVFPKAMKASPLLRSWLQRLYKKGLKTQTRWRWIGQTPQDLRFQTPDGEKMLNAKSVVFALGGASWPRLGSRGDWVDAFETTALRPANMGVNVSWSKYMEPYFGHWVKNVAVRNNDKEIIGEIGITSYGLEGSLIYSVAEDVVNKGFIEINLLPRLAKDRLIEMETNKKGTSLSNQLRKLGLGKAASAMFFECSKKRCLSDVKALRFLVNGARPLEEAISTAGGVKFESLSDQLSLRLMPEIFVAGEMLDWSAPTGGYLLTACLATGRVAGQNAARYALEK